MPLENGIWKYSVKTTDAGFDPETHGKLGAKQYLCQKKRQSNIGSYLALLLKGEFM